MIYGDDEKLIECLEYFIVDNESNSKIIKNMIQSVRNGEYDSLKQTVYDLEDDINISKVMEVLRDFDLEDKEYEFKRSD